MSIRKTTLKYKLAPDHYSHAIEQSQCVNGKRCSSPCVFSVC
jgi:hypothetical protein